MEALEARWFGVGDVLKDDFYRESVPVVEEAWRFPWM